MSDKREIERKLTEALDALVEYYKSKAKDKEGLSPSEQKNLIQLLKDNHVTIDIRKGIPLESILNGDFSDLDEKDIPEFN